jgi:hypothetical protein
MEYIKHLGRTLGDKSTSFLHGAEHIQLEKLKDVPQVTLEIQPHVYTAEKRKFYKKYHTQTNTHKHTK